MALDKFQPYLFVSAGEQSNKLLTPTYADGIAQFQAQRAQSLTGLTVRIEGVQEGTGDPSPTNIRPISGRTGMTVTASGSNLLNIQPQSGTVSGVSYVVDSDGYITLNGTAERAVNLYLATHITPFSHQLTISSDKAMPSNVYSGLVQQNGSSGLLELRPGDTTRTSGESGIAEETRYRMYIVSGVTLNNFMYRPMLNFGAIALPYAPYKGANYPIAWETEAGTVYGGTLDVVSGVLTVTNGYILLDGSQDIRSNGRTTVTQRAIVYIVGKASGTTNIQSDRFAVTSARDAVGKVNGRPASNGVEFYLPLDGTEDTNASCKQWFADNNTQLVYELATPQTYRLTGAEVRTIAGYNQIYSDAGPVIDIKF